MCEQLQARYYCLIDKGCDNDGNNINNEERDEEHSNKAWKKRRKLFGVKNVPTTLLSAGKEKEERFFNVFALKTTSISCCLFPLLLL